MRLANEGAVPQKHDRYEKIEGENPTIGILLCKQSDEALVDLTLPENAKIYAKEYKLYLPDKKLLQKKLKECLIFGSQLIFIQSF